MIERVAQGIAKELSKFFETELTPAGYKMLARAAIAAMREPTDGMLIMGQDDEVSERSMRERWQAMIDAALEEK